MAFKSATVNASLIPSTQANFPAYVDLSRVGITTLAEAQSVRFYADADKIVEWPREIVSVSEAHTKITSFTASTEAFIDYDGVRADYAVTDTYGRNAVWSEYIIVNHGESTTNSTGGTDLTNTGSVAFNSGGAAIGNAAEFNGSNKRLVRTDNASFNASNNYSWSFWMNLDALQGYILDHFTTTGANRRFLVVTDGVSKLVGYTFGFGGLNILEATIATNTLYKVAISKSVSDWTLFIDSANTDTAVSGSSSYSRNGISFGSAEDSFSNADGHIDEMRVKASTITADWETTEYNNQNDEAAFWGTWNDVTSGPDPLDAVVGTFTLSGSVADLTYGQVATDPKIGFPQYDLAFKFRSTAPDITENGLAGDIVLAEFFGEEEAGPAGFTLNAVTASFVVTGTTTPLLQARIIAPTTVSFTYTGIASILGKGIILGASTSSFALSGIAPTIRRQYFLNPIIATYVSAGTTTGLLRGRRIDSVSSAYNLTGTTTPLRASRVLSPVSQSFTLTGITQTLGYGRRLEAQTATYALSTVSVTFARSYRLNPDTGAFVASGVAVTFARTRRLNPETANYLLGGTTTLVIYGRIFDTQTGTFTLTGFAVLLEKTNEYQVLASQQSYLLTGQAVTFARTYVINAQSSSLTTTGAPSTLTATRRLTPVTTSFTYTTVAGNLQRGYRMNAVTASFAVTSVAITTARTYVLSGNRGAFLLTGLAQAVTANRHLNANGTSFDLDNTAVTYRRDYSIRPQVAIYNVTQIPIDLVRTYILELSDGQYVVVGVPSVFQYTGTKYPFSPDESPFVNSPRPFTDDTPPFTKQVSPFSESASPFRPFIRRQNE